MSAFRRYTISITALGALVAACQAIAGINDHVFDAPPTDAGPSPDAIVIKVSPTCGRTELPGKPQGSFASGHDLHVVIAMSSIQLPQVTSPYGFDLDGVCTCDPSDPSLHSGQTSCALPTGAIVPNGCDFDGGVDDSFASVISKVVDAGITGSQSPVDRESKSIRCGEENAVIVLDGYNGEDNDDEVIVSAARASGIYEYQDAGDIVDTTGCGTTGFSDPANGAAFPSRSDGTDVWSLASSDLAEYKARGLGNQIEGYVANKRLVVDARGSSFVLPLGFASRTFSISTPILTGILERDDKGVLRLTSGTLAGRTKARDIVNTFVTALSSGDGGDSCNSFGGALVSSLICSARDIAASPSDDFATPLRACDAISIGLSITGVEARISDTPNDTQGVPCPVQDCPN